MIKKLTCIACPQGCPLIAEIAQGRVSKVSGNKCPKGEEYAKQEIENPQRILTSTLLTQGLALKMAPVRTNQAIPKNKIVEAMSEIKKLRLNRPVKVDEVIIKNFMELGVDLIATRTVE